MPAFLSWTTDAGQQRYLFWDLLVEEQQEFSSTPTEYPVEDEGINVTDHVKRDPVRVSLEVFVTQTPITAQRSAGDILDPRGPRGATAAIKLDAKKYVAPLDATPGAIYAAGGNAIRSIVGALGGDQTISANVLQFAQPFDAVQEMVRDLEEIRDNAQLVNIFTTSRFHPSMLLTKFTMHKNAGTGTGASFHLDFQEIRQVHVKLAPLPVKTETRAKKPVEMGAQSPRETKVPEQSVAKALLTTGVGGVKEAAKALFGRR